MNSQATKHGTPRRSGPTHKSELDTERLLRVVEVVTQLGMSRSKVYRLMQEHVLPTVRVGNSVRVPMKALAQWISENTQPGQKVPVERRTY
jgi:excisionase family DNA binding protein